MALASPGLLRIAPSRDVCGKKQASKRTSRHFLNPMLVGLLLGLWGKKWGASKVDSISLDGGGGAQPYSRVDALQTTSTIGFLFRLHVLTFPSHHRRKNTHNFKELYCFGTPVKLDSVG